MYSPMSRLPYSGITGQVHFLRKRVKPLKRFSVSFFPMKIISKADLGVWLGILTAAEICCCPFDMSSENFSRQCTHLHCPVKKNAFRSFSSHIRGTLWDFMRVGGTEGTHWTSYKIKILSTWLSETECFGFMLNSEFLELKFVPNSKWSRHCIDDKILRNGTSLSMLVKYLENNKKYQSRQ